MHALSVLSAVANTPPLAWRCPFAPICTPFRSVCTRHEQQPIIHGTHQILRSELHSSSSPARQRFHLPKTCSSSGVQRPACGRGTVCRTSSRSFRRASTGSKRWQQPQRSIISFGMSAASRSNFLHFDGGLKDRDEVPRIPDLHRSTTPSEEETSLAPLSTSTSTSSLPLARPWNIE